MASKIFKSVCISVKLLSMETFLSKINFQLIVERIQLKLFKSISHKQSYVEISGENQLYFEKDTLQSDSKLLTELF